MPGQGHQPLSTKGFSRVLAHMGLLPTPPSCRAAGPHQLCRGPHVSFPPRGANVPWTHVKPGTAPSCVWSAGRERFPGGGQDRGVRRGKSCPASTRGHTGLDATDTSLPRPVATAGDSGLLAAGAEEGCGPKAERGALRG